MGFGGAFGLPLWMLKFLKARREAKFVAAFPDAVDIIVRGIKAGLPLLDSLRIITVDAPEPLKSEFRAIVDTQAVGIPIGEACAKLFERIPIPEANFFGIVISIQQRAGGNLSEALGNLSKVLRERQAGIFGWDVWVSGPSTVLGTLKQSGALQPLLPVLRPETMEDAKWTGGFQNPTVSGRDTDNGPSSRPGVRGSPFRFPRRRQLPARRGNADEAQAEHVGFALLEPAEQVLDALPILGVVALAVNARSLIDDCLFQAPAVFGGARL